MPYYKDFSDKKTRDGKRRSAGERGGFDDEGSRYGGTRTHGGKRTPQEQERSGERPARRSAQERGNYADRAAGRRPEQGTTGARPSQERGSYAGRGRTPGAYPANGTSQERGSYAVRGRTLGAYPANGASQERGSYAGRAGNRPAQETAAGRPARGNARYDDRPAREDGRAPRREGTMRFVRSGQQPYRGRGTGTAPRPYDEQRRERRDEGMERGYNEYRYETPARPPRPAYVPEPAGEAVEENENLLSGRNPIREALKSGRDIEKLLVARGELSGSAREIVAMAKEQHVPVQEVDRVRLDAITPHHQGMLAFASAYRYHTVEDMLALAKERGEDPFLVVLDGITDPHNLGAIIRTAECAGAHGVIVQERRAVGLTPAAVKASAGAVEHIMVARVTNLVTALETLKRQNIWLYAADMAGEDYTAVDFSGGAALVIGAEGEGVSRLVLETCDRRVALPVRGKIESLNASVAAGILLYAAMRSRKP